MNRPYWLDLIYLMVFFVPPVVLAVISTTLIERWVGTSGAWGCLLFGAVYVLSIALWIIGLILLSAWLNSRKREPP